MIMQCWLDNQCTVLEVGMKGLSEMEWRTHFSLWAMAAAPLWVGIDMTKMPPAALQIFREYAAQSTTTVLLGPLV